MTFETLEDRRVFAMQVVVVQSSIIEEGGRSVGVVTRDGDLSQPLAVAIASSDSSEATVTWSGVIPANQTSAAFEVFAVDDGLIDGRQLVTITASAAGHANASDTLYVRDNDPAVLLPAPQLDELTIYPGVQPNTRDVAVKPGGYPNVLPAIPIAFQKSSTFQTVGANQYIEADDFLQVEPRLYALSGWAKSGDEFGERYSPANRQSFGVMGYDVDKLPILSEHTQRYGAAIDTTLAAPLNPGDTVIRLVNASYWSNAAGAAAGTRGIAWYGYADSTGHTYADYTYTRNVALGGANGLWAPGGVNGNVITLAQPWSGPALAAGAAVRNADVGEDAISQAINSQPVPGDWSWTRYTAMFDVASRPGLYYVKPFIRANEHGALDNFISWRNISLTPLAPLSESLPPAQATSHTIDLQTITGFDQRVELNVWGADLNWSDTLVKVNPNAQYNLSGWAMNAADVDETPLGFASYDADQKLIHPLHVTRHGFAADTILAAALRPGDTSLLIEDASGWSNEAWQSADTRSLAWYGYANSAGQLYANYTYTRNVAYDMENGLWAPGDIRYDAAAEAYRIHLREPWQGPALDAGAAIRNAASGKAFNEPSMPYAASNARVIPTENYAATIGGGTWQQGQRNELTFRPGTAYIQPVFARSDIHQLTIEPVGNVQRTKPLEVVAGAPLVIELDVLGKLVNPGTSNVLIENISAQFGSATLLPAIGNYDRAVIRYEAPAAFAGTDVVSYTIRDNVSGALFTGSVRINVLGGAKPAATTVGPAAPQAIDDTLNNYSVVAGQTLHVNGVGLPSLLANDVDPVDVLTARLLAAPQHGTLQLNSDGTFFYTPTPGFVGVDTFRYEATDGVNADAAFVSIRVYGSAEELTLTQMSLIGYALANYESATQRFPLSGTAAHYDASGNPYLSWRVHILPYLGYQSLYAKFRLNEPWNSANNLPLAAQMPDFFRSVDAAAGTTTTRIQMFAAEGGEYYWRRSNGRLIGPNHAQITDGVANTLLAIETPEQAATVWTRPENVAFDPANPLALWGTIPAAGINAITAEGYVVTLPSSITAAEMESLVSVSGGETTDIATLHRRRAEENNSSHDFNPRVASYGIDDNLRTIALAMNNYHDSKNAFPYTMPSTAFDENGVPHLSWRVHLLPFLGYTALYNKFNINEPWNSPTNLPLLNEMPDLFRSLDDDSASTTTRFQTFYGAGSPFEPPRSLTGSVGGIKVRMITDELENTLLVVETGAEKAVPWTKHSELPYLPDVTLGVLGDASAGAFRAVTFSGGLISLPVDMPASTLRALITPAGGELIDALAIVNRETQRTGRLNYDLDINRFKQIVLAMDNAEQSMGRWPANTFNAAGQPLLSWRVRILPYLGYGALFKQFRQNEPWDSPHNLALLPLMPDVFRAIDDPSNTYLTRVTTFTGPGAPFPATGVDAASGPRSASFRDGTSNTIAAVQTSAAFAVPWTKPSDTPYNANNPFSMLGDVGPNFMAAMADGSVRLFPSSMTVSQLRAYITINGGEDVNNPPSFTPTQAVTIRQSASDTVMNEAGVDWFDVVLDKAPTANVVLNVSVSNQNIARLSHTSLTFTPTNWNLPQRVAVRGVDNQTVDADRTVEVTVGSQATGGKSFMATIRNDDVAPLAADFTGDGQVDGDDFLRWQLNAGLYATATSVHGDATRDGSVGQDDLHAWEDQFGSVGAAPALADFNGNGAADDADLATWRSNYGRATGVGFPQGDADFDGAVDGDDFLAWQQAYATPIVALAATATDGAFALAMELTAPATPVAAAANGVDAESPVARSSLIFNGPWREHFSTTVLSGIDTLRPTRVDAARHLDHAFAASVAALSQDESSVRNWRTDQATAAFTARPRLRGAAPSWGELAEAAFAASDDDRREFEHES